MSHSAAIDIHAAEHSSGPAGLSSGKLGVWLLISSEIMIFGGLIACYVLFRLAHPEWAHEAGHLSVTLGTINTIILLTSSYTVARAFAAQNRGESGAVIRFLAVTVILAVAFLGIKSYEYYSKISIGILPASGTFWSFYFFMTGFHALHVIVGALALFILMLYAIRGRLAPIGHRVELCALYWHMVDVVWIFLFPLLYLSSSGG